MQDDDATVLDIVIAARHARDFVARFAREQFLDDGMAQSPVMYQLTIIGEAVKRLSMAFRDSHPEIEWQKIAGTRDVLIHTYDRIDAEEVWSIVSEDVPPLITALEPLLPPKPADES